MACGGNTQDGSGAGGNGGGGGGDCPACSLPLIEEGQSCPEVEACCTYGGSCPLVFSCNAGSWQQLPSSSCGYAVPCGPDGLGCAPDQQCVSTAGKYSCSDLPPCVCPASEPADGSACSCATDGCSYLACPAGEYHTWGCVSGAWKITGYAWDYPCAGSS